MLRTGRKGLAAATLLLDGAKGAAAVLLAGADLAGQPQWRRSPAIGAFLGHLYPVWLRFRGGKGVATLLGVVAGSALAGGAGRAPSSGSGCCWLDPLFLGRRHGRARSRAPVAAAVLGRFDLALLFARLRPAGALEAPRQYRPAARRHRAAGSASKAADAAAPHDQIARLRLIRSDKIGPVTYCQLLARFGSAAGGARRHPRSRRARRRPRAAARRRAARSSARSSAVARLGARYLFLGQGRYPAAARRDRRRAAGADRARATRACSTGRRWRWSARATPRPPPAASRAQLALGAGRGRRRGRLGPRPRHRHRRP